jgi:23S rRNA (uracil1939-C5)-methyltransferase
VTPVRILRIAAGGDGVGRLEDGRAVFVPRSAPGDLVELTEVRQQRRFARARVARLIEPGSDRVEPPCRHYVEDDCGGCQLQHLAPDAQRAARRAIVGDALRRLARRDVPDPELEPSGRELEYRTRITLHVEAGGRRIGLHPVGRPDRVFELEHCHLSVPELNRLWAVLRPLRRLLPPRLNQVMLRLDRTGGLHVVLRVEGAAAWNGSESLGRALEQAGVPATIWWHPEGGSARPLGGTGEAFPATVFEQVDPAMGDRVRAFAVAALAAGPGCHVWDLYAGIGETTASLLALGATVESVEGDRRAVEEAEARGPAALRHAGRVEDVLPALGRPDLVITNPPRAGMDSRVTATLERLGPDRIVYISCDPATLARDLGRLPGFRLTLVRAFDLFPQTAHVETVAGLERAS